MFTIKSKKSGKYIKKKKKEKQCFNFFFYYYLKRLRNLETRSVWYDKQFRSNHLKFDLRNKKKIRRKK
jgi:hypothetical protein